MFAIQSQITQLNRSSSQLIAREKRRPAAAMNTIVKASGKDDEAKKKNDMPDRGFLSMFAPEGEKSSEDYNKWKAELMAKKAAAQAEAAKKPKKFLGMF